MKFSDDTHEVLKFLDFISENKLRRRQDLGIALEVGANYGEYKLVNNLIFSGKSFWNLAIKLQKTTPNAEGVEVLEREFERTLYQMQEDLAALIEFAPLAEKTRLQATYLMKTKQSVISLIDLSHDLAFLKDLQTQSKDNRNRQSPQA